MKIVSDRELARLADMPDAVEKAPCTVRDCKAKRKWVVIPWGEMKLINAPHGGESCPYCVNFKGFDVRVQS